MPKTPGLSQGEKAAPPNPGRYWLGTPAGYWPSALGLLLSSINYALSHKTHSGWMLHLDADIALPTDLHQIIDDAYLDESCIHGCDRLNVPGPAPF